MKINIAISVVNVVVAIFAMSCSETSRIGDVEYALQLAGENRLELEKVLDHYRSGGDEQKYEAAKFLIANMPGHYSYADQGRISQYYVAVDSIACMVGIRSDMEICDSINKLARQLHLNRMKTIEDVKIVTSSFLIDNIDVAFRQWREGAWARHLTFEEFCEYLLPYKVCELQPLNGWRSIMEYVNDRHLKHIADCDMLANSSFYAADFMYKYINAKYHPSVTAFTLSVPVLSPEIAVKIPFGDCRKHSTIGAMLYRSVGIPVMCDFTPMKGNENIGHHWNVLKAPNGKDVVFNAMTDSPKERHLEDTRIAKAYRRIYAVNQDIVRLNIEEEFVPEEFRNIHIKDVTDEHTKCCDIIISTDKAESNYIYLAVSSGEQWQPIAFAGVNRNGAKFDDVGVGCVYMPVYYRSDGTMVQSGFPFYVDYDGETHSFRPDLGKMSSVSLDRKMPVREYVHHTTYKTDGAVIEASNNSLFSNPVRIAEIRNAKSRINTVDVNDSVGSFRYWRYVSKAPDSRCNLAELYFVEAESGLVNSGVVIGSGGASDNHPSYTFNMAFDGDPLTYFDAADPEDAWVGMDFGRPVRMGAIRFLPRGDGNTIEPGDTYELLYRGDSSWVSLGCRKASDFVLIYDDVPENALLLLVDRSKGKEHRIFSYNNENQWFY